MLRSMTSALPLIFLVLALSPIQGAEPLPAAAGWVPPDAVLALEISRPKPLLDLALDPRVAAAVTSSAPYKKAAAEAKFREMQAGIAFLEARLAVGWRDALHRLLDGGVLLTVHPRGGVLLVVDAQDGKLLRELHQALVEIARAEAAKDGQPDRVKSREYDGQTVWTFGKDEAHVTIGNRLLWANRPALLKEVLDLRAGQGQGLAALPAYREARKAAHPDAVGTAFVDMKAVAQVPGVRKLLAKSENPLAALLFSAVTHSLREAPWVGLGLSVRQRTLLINAASGGNVSPPPLAAFAAPQGPGQGAKPNLDVPGLIAGMSFYRDLHAFYSAKDQLFPERTSGLIFFENMMGIFFTGRDLTDEVFAETRPEIRLVAARQEYDTAVAAPRVQLPAFALVLHVRHPEKAAEMAEEAWQKAIGLVNVTQGQKALPGMIIDRATHQDVRYSFARFSTAGLKDKADLDIRFNFRPALACVGEYLALASTEALAKDLIDALKKETTEAVKPLDGVHSLLELQGAHLASALHVNRQAIVRKNMVEEGKTQEQAESEFDLLVGLLRHLGRARLDVRSHQGRQQAALELKLDIP